MNSAFSLMHPGAIHPILQIVLVQNSYMSWQGIESILSVSSSDNLCLYAPFFEGLCLMPILSWKTTLENSENRKCSAFKYISKLSFLAIKVFTMYNVHAILIYLLYLQYNNLQYRPRVKKNYLWAKHKMFALIWSGYNKFYN